MWNNDEIIIDRGKLKYPEVNLLQYHFTTTNPIWTAGGLILGFCGEKMATNYLNDREPKSKFWYWNFFSTADVRVVSPRIVIWNHVVAFPPQQMVYILFY
jgi:hypothetical protein